MYIIYPQVFSTFRNSEIRYHKDYDQPGYNSTHNAVYKCQLETNDHLHDWRH